MGQSTEHDDYLAQQIERTLSKRDAKLPARAVAFIDRVDSCWGFTGRDVLCIGCRNTGEIAAIRGRGARRVTGIDLYSESADILVMDMHALTFGPASFDLIYSSHSFEHARDPRRVASEMLRVLRPGGAVAIEVPVHFEPRGADLHDYGSADGLLAPFADAVTERLFVEEVAAVPPSPPSLRVVFRAQPGETV